ncbi:MAG: hypothetical protein H9893_09020 [Candidatus Niameybacter stercoravium]|nr:hypothetical protein [Candidatus Niameybacter stercoravium]
MTILWLILKIILILLGALIGVVICLLLALLFIPLEYRLRAEKYEVIAYYMQFKIFYLISIVYDSKTNNSIKIRLCGRTIKEISFEEAEDQAEEKLEKTQKVVTKATQEEAEDITENKRVQQQSKSTRVTHTDESKKTQVSSSVEKLERITQGKSEQARRHEGKQTASKKQNKASNHSCTEINWIETIKFIWEDENRGPFIRFCKALLKDLWHAIRPKGMSFNLILGLDDPAETGMWLAKLMALYPFYAPYGNVVGDFEKATFEGYIKLFGKTNLYRFIKPLIVFVTHKEVRNYIKLLMKIGKDE